MVKEFDEEFEKLLSLKSFLSNSKSVVFFSLDFEGNVLFCNEGYNRILNYNEINIKGNLLNPLFQSLMIESQDSLIFSGIMTFKKTGANTSFLTQVYKFNNKLFFLCEYDGFEVETFFKEMSVNALLMNNMNRELVKKEIMLKVAISKQKETLAMLVQSDKMNALGQLAAGVAHEINNPMTYVMGNVEIMGQYAQTMKKFLEDYEKDKILDIKKLKEKYDIDNILEDFSAIQKSTLEGCERIKKIVSEMRDFSRIDSSEKSLCSIAECIKDSLKIAELEINRNAITLELNFSEISDVECYPAQLNQVFLNIIINAIQATGNKGHIIINLYEKKNFIFVQIEDNGAGILDGNKSKIFEPFFTTKPKGIGVGLGLNLSYKIIKDMHKGDICFDSIAGKGTVFTISISKGEK